MFIVIVVLSALVYLNYSSLAEKRNEVALKTEGFVQELLKGRISVYQFLRNPSSETAQKVRENFKTLDKDVLALKEEVSVERNKVLCDEILASSKKYIESFEIYSKGYSKDVEETPELKAKLAEMVKVGEVLESKIKDINKSALQLKEEAHSSLNSILMIVAIVAIIAFFIVFINCCKNCLKLFRKF